MMYNTGDIVSWNEDGSLNTFGRTDDQVKIKVAHREVYSRSTLTFVGLPSRAGWRHSSDRSEYFFGCQYCC
jgi:hypothetical protein